MAKFLAVCFAVVVLAAALPVHAQPFGMDPDDMETTRNPDHRGWAGTDELEPVDWQDIDARCKECQPLAVSYNKVMRQLLYTRFWIAYINDMSRRRSDMDRFMKNFGRKADGAVVNRDGMATEHEQLAAAMMNYEIGLDELKSKLPALRDQEASLKALADDLLKQLDACEKQRCQKAQDGGVNFVELQGVNPKAASALPFDWKGPYPEVCNKCAKLAQRLNDLPDIARTTLSGLEDARAELMSAEVEMAALQMEHQAFIFANNPLDGRTEKQRADEQYKKTKEMEKSIKELERIKDKAEGEIAKYEADVDAIIKNFSETLKLYEECVPTCPKETGMVDPEKPKTEYALSAGVNTKWNDSCFAGLDYKTTLTLGANSEWGTGAAMKNKAKDMATGAAMGALGKMIGGGGISLGGLGGGGRGDDGGGSDGPKLDKFPFNKKGGAEYEWTGMYIGINGGFTDKGFVLTQEIKDSPDGNSTFHSTWLQDQKGKAILPTQYYVYDIYRDHKLTVWWTYDHWTNGVHDDHDEGRETTEWRENLGNLRLRFDGEKGIENSIWYQSGFDTAVKGVRKMGALYSITPEDLTGCGLNSMTYYTIPSKDPVTAVPLGFNVHLESDDKGYPVDPTSLQFRFPPF